MIRLLKLILLITILGCKNQKSKKIEEIGRGEQRLETFYKNVFKEVKGCYSKPANILFKERILEVYGIDIDNSIYYEGNLSVNDYSETVFIKENIIFPEAFVLDTASNNEDLCNYNKMVFYEDIVAINNIKRRHPKYIVNLVKEYGYTGNKNWLEFAFGREELYKPEELESFLFGFRCDSIYETDGGTECKGQYQLRKEMLEKMIEYGAELSQLSTVANMVSNASQSSYEEDINYLYAYLMAYCFKAGQTGLIEYLYDTNPKMKDVFKEHSYFNVEGLEDYTNTLYISREKRFGLSSIGPDKFEEYGIINDPDGYTNLRKGKGTSHEVIRKIVEGEKFGIELKEGDWWAVVLEDGTEGWIHKSRVKILKDYSFTDNR